MTPRVWEEKKKPRIGCDRKKGLQPLLENLGRRSVKTHEEPKSSLRRSLEKEGAGEEKLMLRRKDHQGDGGQESTTINPMNHRMRSPSCGRPGKEVERSAIHRGVPPSEKEGDTWSGRVEASDQWRKRKMSSRPRETSIHTGRRG